MGPHLLRVLLGTPAGRARASQPITAPEDYPSPGVPHHGVLITFTRGFR